MISSAQMLFKSARRDGVVTEDPTEFVETVRSMAWASGAQLFKAQGDAWVQTLNDPACEKVLTYWDGLIKKKLVSTIPGFTAEFYNAIGSGQIAASVEGAWGHCSQPSVVLGKYWRGGLTAGATKE